MLEQTFTSLYGDTGSVMSNVTTAEFFICCIASVILGMIAAWVYTIKHEHSKNFVVTLALLPLIVQAVITLVNGNLGAGVAVMGVFNLVRFRSIPGTAKDITSVFLAMAIGLATGMGFVALAVLFTVIVCAVNIAFVLSPFGNAPAKEMTLKITIPEDLEYSGLFDDVLAQYTQSAKLSSVSTSNMGALFKLEYLVRLKDTNQTKAMIDSIRALNGNLKVSLCYAPVREAL